MQLLRPQQSFWEFSQINNKNDLKKFVKDLNAEVIDVKGVIRVKTRRAEYLFHDGDYVLLSRVTGDVIVGDERFVHEHFAMHYKSK